MSACVYFVHEVIKSPTTFMYSASEFQLGKKNPSRIPLSTLLRFEYRDFNHPAGVKEKETGWKVAIDILVIFFIPMSTFFFFCGELLVYFKRRK